MNGNIYPFLLTLGGIALFFAAIHLLVMRKKIIDNGQSADATVVRIERRGFGRSRRFHPVFSYEADGGTTLETVHHIGSPMPKYVEGEVVRIVYNKEDPKKITIEGDSTYAVRSVIYVVLGVFLLGIGIFYLI